MSVCSSFQHEALSRYVGVHQAAVEARRVRQLEAARRASVVTFAATAEAQERRAAAGLVSLSTSGFHDLPVAIQWASKCITIDRKLARVSRLRRSVGLAAKVLLNVDSDVGRNNVMVTLTYDTGTAEIKFGSYWKPRHVSDYIRDVRSWFKERCPGERLRYVWVAEMQERGVLHYHCVFFLPDGVKMPQADRKGWWPHGMSNTLKARSPVAYLMKYTSKVDSKNVVNFPRGARISGAGGLDNVGRAIRSWCLAPAYVRGNGSCSDRFRPAQGGGWTSAVTGEHLAAEFAPTGGGFDSFIRIRQHAHRFDTSGPFNWITDRPASFVPASVTVH